MVFKVLMLRFISKPISTTIELRKIIIIITIIVPIDPYRILYLPKLFTKAVKPMVTRMDRKVAITEPGETRFHRLVVEGA